MKNARSYTVIVLYVMWNDGVLSEYYRNEMGLMQGVVVSPLLFALYINDFEINIVTMKTIVYPLNYKWLIFFY